jgi:hypothetical protein
MSSIVLISTGSPATNPRLVKEANTLQSAGHSVHVLYSHIVDWAEEVDQTILGEATWTAELIGGSPNQHPWTYATSVWSFMIVRRLHSLRFRTSRLTRTSRALAIAARSQSADLFIAHNLGALPAAVLAAQHHNSVAAFDAEDYHYGEFSSDSWEAKLTRHVEDVWIPQCDATWSASPLIASAYQERFPRHTFDVVDNVFPLTQRALRKETGKGRVRMMWFSQTIGEGRGLEPLFDALRQQVKGSWSLTLIGRVSRSFEGTLEAFRSDHSEQVHVMPPMNERELFQHMARHDIGLALEIGTPLNRNLCRTNKLFGFILNGCYLLLTDTQAQSEFIELYPKSGTVVPLDSLQSWCRIIHNLIQDKASVNDGKTLNWNLGESELNWEVESKKLLSIVQTTLASPTKDDV